MPGFTGKFKGTPIEGVQDPKVVLTVDNTDVRNARVLTAGTNITITDNGSAARTVTISATGGGGGGLSQAQVLARASLRV